MSRNTFNKNKHSWSEIKEMLNTENEFANHYSVGDILYINLKDPTETLRCQITKITRQKSVTHFKIDISNTVLLSMIDTIWCLPFDGYEGDNVNCNTWSTSDLYTWLNETSDLLVSFDKESPYYKMGLFKDQIDPEFVKIINEVELPNVYDIIDNNDKRYSLTGAPVDYWIMPRKCPSIDDAPVCTRKGRCEFVNVGLSRYVCPTFTVTGYYHNKKKITKL